MEIAADHPRLIQYDEISLKNDQIYLISKRMMGWPHAAKKKNPGKYQLRLTVFSLEDLGILFYRSFGFESWPDSQK